jgi:hypothetical protein
LEVETECLECDNEGWQPRLYHQGLQLDADVIEALPGTVVSWGKLGQAEQQHPERPTMYVFGHHDVSRATLVFGPISAGRILISWSGCADVFWDDQFKARRAFQMRMRSDDRVADVRPQREYGRDVSGGRSNSVAGEPTRLACRMRYGDDQYRVAAQSVEQAKRKSTDDDCSNSRRSRDLLESCRVGLRQPLGVSQGRHEAVAKSGQSGFVVGGVLARSL